jgi:uncharacterized protein (DUF2147 family)
MPAIGLVVPVHSQCAGFAPLQVMRARSIQDRTPGKSIIRDNVYMIVRNFIRFAPLTAILAVGSLVQAASGDQIQGTWSPDNGRESKIEITRCGDRYCGVIVWMKMPRNDDKNVDPAQRSRPLVAARIMNNFKYDGSAWVGTLYSPERGKSVEAKFVLVNKNQIEIRETVGESKTNVIWRRVVN